MIRTALTDFLGVKHPILNAPMATSATAELAAAVSGSGGFGMLGMGNTTPDPEWLEFQIKGTTLHQTATFRARGILGRMYWYVLLPFHAFIFRGLINRLAK